MRSIRLRRRPEVAPASADVDGSAPADSPEPLELALPRDLLPADKRERADRPALARRLRAMTHPRFYAAQVGAPEVADDVDAAITHFLETGLRAGARISGLFNPEIYRQR